MSALLFLAIAAAPVQAGDIVVTGKAQTPQEERKELRDYVRKTGVAKGETQAARWIDRVCPRVYGVPAAVAEQVVARVRAVAEDAGIKTAKPNCEANIAITFVDDGAGFARIIQKKSRRHISSVSLRDKEELFASDAPVRWWYGLGATDRDGVGGASSAPALLGGGEGGVSVISGIAGNAPITSGNQPSIIGTNAIRTISTATVVIDVNRASGTPLDAVADYAAFVALAEIDPPKIAPQQSVLTLFAGGSGGLTARDRDFLTALYKIALNREAYQQRARLTGKLVKAVQD